MDPKDWARLLEVYEAARELEPKAREELVRERLGDRPDLASEALGMLGISPPPGFVEPLQSPMELDQLFGGGLEGKRVGEFELVRELGRGGMGVVYLARQPDLDRPVAVKVLPLSRARDEKSLERFRREAKASSQLEHPHIAQVLTFGEGEHTAWFAMRYVDGHDLAAEITAQRAARKGEPHAALLLPAYDSESYVGTVVHRLAEVAEALQHAHDHGVVHRDVKPQNILLDKDGRMHLVDFGLAKDERFGSLTQTGDLRGTPYYMSPEQARAGAVRVDHRTDLYSLSVVLYELLALRRPYEGRTSQEVIARISRTEPEPLRKRNPRVPRDLAVICAKGMSKLAEERYASADELAADLRRFLHHEAIAARPLSARERGVRWMRRHRLAVAAALGLALALTAGFVFAQWRDREKGFDALHARITDVLELEDWSTAWAALADVRARLASEPGFGSRAGSTRARDLERFRERLDAFRSDQSQRGEDLIAAGLGGASELDDFEPYLAAPSPQSVNEGLMLLQRLALLFPDDRLLTEGALLERSFPRLRIDAEVVDAQGVARPARAEEAEAWLAPIDPLRDAVGEARAIGTSPFAEVSVPAGFWQIEVRVPGHGRAQLRRHVETSVRPLELSARVHPEALLSADMVRIPAGTLTLLDERPVGCLQGIDRVEVGDVLLDPAEVSNAAFHDYLVASANDPPVLWGELGYEGTWESIVPEEHRSAWPDLPVVGLNWRDALAFAEWHGKRLPTHTELERAFAGADVGARLPGEPGGDPAGRANVGRAYSPLPDPTPQASYAIYLANVLPVRDPRCLQTEYGLYHAYGNVQEFTSSWLVEIEGASLRPSLSDRVVYGCFWDARARGSRLDRHNSISSLPKYLSYDVGFRCAY